MLEQFAKPHIGLGINVEITHTKIDTSLRRHTKLYVFQSDPLAVSLDFKRNRAVSLFGDLIVEIVKGMHRGVSHPNDLITCLKT